MAFLEYSAERLRLLRDERDREVFLAVWKNPGFWGRRLRSTWAPSRGRGAARLERAIAMFMVYATTNYDLADIATEYTVSRATVRSAVRQALWQLRLLHASN
jgi:hypothetical protein